MKKIALMLSLAISLIACDKKLNSSTNTAYIDTVKMMEEYDEVKELNDKFKTKSEVAGKELQESISKFKSDVANAQKIAPVKGGEWQQKVFGELQQREQQLQYAQQAMAEQLQSEQNVEYDSVKEYVKKTIKEYGKEKGYEYIYGTGESPNVLYAKDSYDITKDMIKLLNEKYVKRKKEKEAKKETKSDVKKDSLTK